MVSFFKKKEVDEKEKMKKGVGKSNGKKRERERITSDKERSEREGKK